MKLAEARAEAARLYVEQRMPIPAIAKLMLRSEEGVELLLKYGGVEIRDHEPPAASAAPVSAPALQIIEPEPPVAASPAPASQVPGLIVGQLERPSRRPMGERDGFVRLNGVKPRVLTWCRAYVKRGVRVSYLAGLFNLDVDALALALDEAI